MIHFNVVWVTNERSCAILWNFPLFWGLGPDFKREQCQEQELSAPLGGQRKHTKCPQREQKVLVDFQARGTVFSSHCSNVNTKKDAKYMQVFSDADIKPKNTMPCSLKRLLISCSRKSYQFFEQGKVTSSKIYQIHSVPLVFCCMMCTGQT